MFILSKYSCFDTENISSFLPSSLLSALEECFPVAKWNHTHKVQHKVFYCSIMPATKDVPRTCCWLVSAEAACAAEAHPPQMPGGWKCQVQALVRNLHHTPWDLRAMDFLLGLTQKSLCSQREPIAKQRAGRATIGMLFLEWGQEEPEKRDFQEKVSFQESYCPQLTWLCQYDSLLLVTQLKWLWSRASSVILNCNVK